MVNTFLPYPDFAKSASSLDRARLGKQRVEAFQVLTIIEHLKTLSLIFSFPYPKCKDESLTIWIKTLLATYKSLPYFYIISNDMTSINDVYSISKEIITINGKIDRKKVLEYKKEGYTIITTGFMYHPCVKMWFYHTNSLKEYINIHINEWIRRGYNNTMKIYPNINNEIKPYFNFSNDININHRAALYKKEVMKNGSIINKNSWYLLKSDFIDANDKSPFVGYIWPIDKPLDL